MITDSPQSDWSDKVQEIGLTIGLSEFDDVAAMTAIIRITGGNFRLVQRLLAQATRVTKGEMEAVRESLTISAI